MYFDTCDWLRLWNLATSLWYCFSTNTLWTISTISSGSAALRLVLYLEAIASPYIGSSSLLSTWKVFLQKYPLYILAANEVVSLVIAFLSKITPKLFLTYSESRLDSSKHFNASYLNLSRAYVIYFPYILSLYIGSDCFSVVIIISGFWSRNYYLLQIISQVPIALVYLDTLGRCPSSSNSVAMTYAFAQESVLEHTCMIRVH